jgi:YbbR domain-containing protein
VNRLLAAAFRWLRAAFTENSRLKAVSLVFAIGLFVYLNRAEEEFDRTFPVGVFSQKPPDSANRELMTQIPPNIYVTLRGSSHALEQLMREDPPLIELDLRDGETQVVRFDETMFELPRGVEVLMFDPPTIQLEWQDVVSRSIPVQAALTGTPAEGYVVSGQPLVSPREVVVEGPKRVVEVMQFARLAAFDVTGLTEGEYRRPIAIDAPPPRVHYVGLANITVNVKIARRVSEAKFERLGVEVIGVSNGVTNPRQVEVTVVGPPEVVRALRAEQIVPRADLAAAKIDPKKQPHGSAVVPVTVDVGNAETHIQPPTVTVKW